MATRKFKFKHIAESATVHVGDTGELILDTDANTLKVSDGSTAGGVQVKAGVDYSSIEIKSSAGSTNSGSPTALDVTKTVSLINHKDGTVRYYSLADGTSDGQIKIIRYMDSAKNGGGSSRVISFSNLEGESSNTYSLSSSSAVQLLWRIDKWMIIAESNN